MSLSSYTVSLFREPRRFVAIPIFPSRFFRHSCIYVNAKSGIRTPKDLIGKKVGVPEFQMTAPVWIRGTLDELYGVPVDSVTYYTGGEEEPGRSEKLALDLPANIKVQPIAEDKTLSQMLRDGEIDLMLGALRVGALLEDLHQEPVFEDSPQLVMRAGHPLLAEAQPMGQRLADFPWILPARDTPLRRYWAPEAKATLRSPRRGNSSARTRPW
jgi:ABC-type amino acid transport substrate-binding protein